MTRIQMLRADSLLGKYEVKLIDVSVACPRSTLSFALVRTVSQL